MPTALQTDKLSAVLIALHKAVLKPASHYLRVFRRAALLCLLASTCAPALAIYKFETDGKTGYSDTPCPGGREMAIDQSPSVADIARGEKQVARDRVRAKQIEHEKRKLEAQEEKERQRSAHAMAAHRKRCSLLERRKNWAEEDAASAKGKSVAKTKLKAKRIEEQFEEECGSGNRAMISS